MSDVQPNSEDSASEIHSTSESNGANKTRKRRGPADQIAIARGLKEIAPIGDWIAYSQLSRDQRRAVLPSNKMKWLNSELVESHFNEEVGTLESVRLIPEGWEANKWQLDPEPTEVTRRTIFSDPRYKLIKMQSDNPRREGSHASYNWEYCYHDNMAVCDYLRFMDYPRDIIITNSRGSKSWFNGPASILLIQDIGKRYVGIYDSTLPNTDPNYWQKVELFGYEESDEDEPESAIPETDHQTGESTVPAMVA